MKPRARIACTLAWLAGLAGCATPPFPPPSAMVISPRAKVVPAKRVEDNVTIGRSTKADVLAALGETLVIGFDTGYEVWLYRLDRTRGDEFVILFTPNGVVSKTRVRRETRGS